MNSKTIQSKIELLYNWLKSQEFTSNIELTGAPSWLKVEHTTGVYVPYNPGIYIVRLKKPVEKGSDIVYIGQTDDLNRRIGFLRSAIRSGTAPHSGGKRLRELFGPDLTQFEICWYKTTNVYAAKLFERFLIVSFIEEEERLPIGNKDC